MRQLILPYQIRRILGDRYKDLHREILGVDISDREVMPIHRGLYFADIKDEIGQILVKHNTPAVCIYETGELYFLYDERIPLTEARIVHEFLHRAARREGLTGYVSGVDTRPDRTEANEIITEYLTLRIVGEDYHQQIHPNNRYLPALEAMAELEEKYGITRLVRDYLNGKFRIFAGRIPGEGRS